jgi:phage recombination protein Bet
MSTELATHEQVGTERWTREQIELVKNLIAPNSTDAELQLFEMVCRRTRLDPFTGQIRALKRRVKVGDNWEERLSIQTGIDGFRLIAERTGKYRGQIGPLWCGEDGVWKEVWLSTDTPPSAAKVGILRDGFDGPIWSVARWGAYAQTKADGQLTRMWMVMGDFMLGKCAESLGLRKTFPQELSGLYTDDEMGQADRGQPEPRQSEPTPQPKLPPKKETLPASKLDEVTKWWNTTRFETNPDDPDETFAVRFENAVKRLSKAAPSFCTVPADAELVGEYVREQLGMGDLAEFRDLTKPDIDQGRLAVILWLKQCKPLAA